MATDTTGSTVKTLNRGLAQHLGGGGGIIFVHGNPSGIVNGLLPGGTNQLGVSGNLIAYDKVNNRYYLHAGSMVWQQLGSVSFG